MKIKVSNIRLTNEHQQTDQDSLNNLLAEVIVIKTCSEIITGKINLWSNVIFYEDKNVQKNRSLDHLPLKNDNQLTSEEEEKFDQLKKWRQEKAAALNIPAYMVCHNKDLLAITKSNPSCLEDFQNIRGFGEKKIENYGAEITEIMKRS